MSSTGSRVCPLCGRDNHDQPALSLSRAPWLLKHCASCGFTYLENPPGYAALEEEYAWEKTSAAEGEHRNRSRPVSKSLSNAFKRFRQRVLKRDKLIDLMRQHIPRGRVLDIGCADAGILMRLPGKDYIPCGIEISKALAAAATARVAPLGGEIVQANALDGARQLPDAHFDGVVMSAFLEHEAQPLELLRELQRILKPGGKGIIKVPNYGSINRRVRGDQWCGLRFPDHVNYFTPDSLKAMLAKVGLQVCRFGWADRFPLSDNMWLVFEKSA
jgi:SAM-dependent methyltransferase